MLHVALAVLVAIQAGTAAKPAIVPLAWSRAIAMPDGRTFVSDGAMAIDAKIAKPATTPAMQMPVASGKLLEGQMTGTFTDEVALATLRPGTLTNTFVGPHDIPLDGAYVSFLRRVAPASRLRFNGPMRAVVIVLGQQTIGLVMPKAMAK
jgi:hypothetical protein